MKLRILAPVILFFIIYTNTKSYAQPDSLNNTIDINNQVWIPFTRYIISGDNDSLSYIHSKRITRVQIDQNSIIGFDKYFPAQKTTGWTPPQGSTRFFELRFNKRINSDTKAWETGIYKGGLMKNGKEVRSYYGRFYVVLEKENGIWKILVDADTSEAVTEKDFKNAAAL